MKIEEILCKPLEKLKRKDSKKSLIKVTELLLRLNKKSKTRYFDAPSILLRKINGRYKKYIDILLEEGIIDYYSTEEDKELFNDSNHSQNKRKSYSTTLHQSIRYKFNIKTKDIIYDDCYTCEKKWCIITEFSLIQLGLSPKYKRCTYGRRLHTQITSNMSVFMGEEVIKSYKDFFKLEEHKDKYVAIDIKQSQPTFLYNIMKDNGYACESFFNLIENEKDIYYYMQDNLNLSDNREEGRDLAKSLFQRFISKKDNSIEIKGLNKLFKGVKRFCDIYNKNDYKRVNTLLQRKESKLVIDGILDNIEIDFCLTVHDSFIVKKEDSDKLYNELKDKYKDLKIRFDITFL